MYSFMYEKENWGISEHCMDMMKRKYIDDTVCG
jgi:hypothetical protein